MALQHLHKAVSDSGFLCETDETARWRELGVNYARAFHYDEEERLTKIERDFGNGNLRTA